MWAYLLTCPCPLVGGGGISRRNKQSKIHKNCFWSCHTLFLMHACRRVLHPVWRQDRRRFWLWPYLVWTAWLLKRWADSGFFLIVCFDQWNIKSQDLWRGGGVIHFFPFTVRWSDGMRKQLAWALFVLLLSTLVCCLPTELIWAFLFHKFSNFTPRFFIEISFFTPPTL